MASDIRSRIGIDGEASYRQAISQIVATQKQLKAEMKATSAEFATNTSEQKKAKAATESLKKQIELANGKLKEQEGHLKALEADGKGSTKEAINLRTAIAKTKTEIIGLNNELAKNSPLAAFGRDMQDAGKKIQDVGGSISAFGGKMTKAVTVPIAAAGAAAVKLAVDFESSMAKLDTIADSSEKSIETLRTEILDLSDATGVSASELAEQAYQAISAGRSTGEAVNFVAKTARLAKAGFADTGSALDVLTTILNAYGKSEEEVAVISDQLIMTQNLGKTSVGQLAETMGQVIPTAAAFGVSLENIESAYVTLTKQGINTAGATTRINGLLNQLGKTGTKSANALEEKTGKSFKELMDSGYSLSEVLEIVQDSAEESGLSLSDMFGNVRAGQAALAIMNDDGVTFTETLEAMGDAAGATDDAFAKLENTTAYKFEKTLNRVKNVGIQTGQSLLIAFGPAIEKIAGAIEKAADKFGSLTSEQQQAIVKAAAFAAAIGPASSAIGALTTGVGKATEGIGKLAENWGVSANTLGTASAGVTMGAVGAAAALTALIVILSDTKDEVNSLAAELDEEARASQKLADEIGREASARAESVSAMDEKEKRADELVSTLEELQGKTQKTAAEEQQMVSAVGELNAIYPDLNLVIDKHTGNLTKDSQAALENIDALKKQARAVAYQEQYATVMKEIVDAEIQLEKAKKTAAEATKAHDAATQEATDNLIMYGDALAGGQNHVLATAEANKDAEKSVSDLTSRLEDLHGEEETLTEFLEANSEALNTNADSTEEAAGSAELLVEAEENLGDTMEEETAKIVEGAKLQAGAFEEVSNTFDVSLDSMIKGLESQVTAYQNYSANMTTALEYARNSGSAEVQALVDKLVSLGMAGAGEMQAFAEAVNNGSTDSIDSLVSLNSSLAQEEANFETYMAEYYNSAYASMAKTSSNIDAQRPRIMTSAKAAAQAAGSGYRTGARSAGMMMYTDTGTAMSNVGKAIDASKSTNSAKATSAGTAVGNANASGVLSTKAANAAAGDSAANAAVTAAAKKESAARTVGANIGSGIESGILGKVGKIAKAAADAAQAAIDAAKRKAQVQSPSRVMMEVGGYMSEGLALGMTGGIPMIRNAAEQIAAAAVPGMPDGYASLPSNGLTAEDIASAFRDGSEEPKIYLNGRELTRGLKSMGVVFDG